jgi:hypothetical protein
MKTLALTPKYTATTPMVNEDERSDLANDLVPLGQAETARPLLPRSKIGQSSNQPYDRISFSSFLSPFQTNCTIQMISLSHRH